MPVTLPSNPTNGQSYIFGGVEYVFDGPKNSWRRVANPAQTIEDLSNVSLDVVPETLTFAVDSVGAGGSPDWLWTWKSGALPYARTTILNQAQASVPLYALGTYTLYNFAAHHLHGNLTQTHGLHLKWIEGAGTQNNISWATSTYNVPNISVEGVHGGSPMTVQRLNINVPEVITPPTLTPPTVAYGITAVPGAYQFDNVANDEQNPTLGPLYRGGTYTFNVNASGHPFYLTTDNGASFSPGSYAFEYTNGVTGSRTDNGTVTFTVPQTAPDTLYYQCGNHSSMRGQINIKDLAVETNSAGNYIVYFQHSQEGHMTPVELRPKPGITGQVCLVYDAGTGKFVPQDIADYLEQTVVMQEKVGDIAEDEIEAAIAGGEIVSLTNVRDDTIFTINLSQQGELETHTGTARWYAPFDLTITDITARVNGSADAEIQMDVKRNGVVMKNLTITAGTFLGGAASPSFGMAEDDYLTLDTTQVGSAIKGSDLVVQFKYKKTTI
jgi:hypothetical protein